jgi:choline monooxygenase
MSLDETIKSTADALDGGFTPTAAWYYDPALYQLEQDRIFGRMWQLVGLAVDVEAPGSYMTVGAGEREFVIVRDAEGRLRAYHNVCPHRANRLLEGCGTARWIQCRYHGWTYELGGRLHSAPGMEPTGDFDPADFALREVSVAVWGPFVFVNPDPTATSLEAYLGSIPAYVARLGLDLDTVARGRNFLVDEQMLECNWKVAVENSLECYHCPTAHPSLRATLDFSRRDVRIVSNGLVERTYLRSGDSRTDQAGGMGASVWEAAACPGGLNFSQLHWLFPNQSLSIWPGPGNSFTLNRWLPLGPERTRWWIGRWWPADLPAAVREQQWEFVLRVAREDVKIVEGVQRGVRSGAWLRGRYQLAQQTRTEHGPRAFSMMVTESLASVRPVDWQRRHRWEVDNP